MTEIVNNLLIETKKFFIGIKDLVVKLITMFIAMLFVLDGPDNSDASQPFPIGSCFHPRTLVKLKNGEICQMQDIPLGAELEDGSKVFAVLKVDNHKKEPLYRIKNNETSKYIYVTGEHFVLDNNNWIKVKDYKDAELQNDITSHWFSCLITTNHRIKIGEHVFWDWEDDILHLKE
jgi:hypothetical protein